MSKSVLITGATRGLGRGLAQQFASRGYSLVLTGRNVNELEALATELEGSPGTIIVRELDVTDFDNVETVIQHCAQDIGGLEIVVANAGFAAVTPAGEGKLAEIRKTIDVNLTGAIATAEAAIKLFRQQGYGQLVGISSFAAVRGMKQQGAYCATKSGFSAYLQSVGCDTFDEPITVTDLAPGYIDTDLNRSLASRPFLVSAEKGTRIMVDLIERKVAFSYVPPWPWRLMAALVKMLPRKQFSKM